MLQDVVLAVTVRAHRGIEIAAGNGNSVNALPEILCDLRMAFRTSRRDVQLIDPGRTLQTFRHLMAAVTVDAISGLAISV